MSHARTYNALLVYPRFPPSYWGFQYAIELLGKRSAMPPLGLITVGAMFPDHYRLRLVDMNVQELRDQDLDWADLVLTSTMVVQQRSLQEVISRTRGRGTPIAVGGPHPTSYSVDIAGASYYLMDEVEETFPRFLADWEDGRATKVYRTESKPPVTATPVPRFDLLDLDAYGSMALQFSRGCPFNCEFCDITKLFGRVPRTKSNEQMLGELDRLYATGWRGAVFLVDDNFIGNKREALRLLPAVADWQKQRGYPFDFYTEASVNLAKLEPLMDAMVDAGFTMTFLGIESPNPEALKKTNKVQNTARDDHEYLLHAVETIQRKGLEVSGGFILGLDGDGPEIFDAQVEFIQRAGIPMAMVGLLTAIRGTDLYARLDREGRLVSESSGNNVEIVLNFEPELDRSELIGGYRRVLSTLYDPGLKSYFERCWTLLARLGQRSRPPRSVGRAELVALLRSLRIQLLSRQGPAYLKFLARTLARRPKLFAEAIRLAIKGLHFQRFTAQTLAAHDYREAALAAYGRVEEAVEEVALVPSGLQESLRAQVDEALRGLRRFYRRLRPEFRTSMLPDRSTVEMAIRACVREAGSLQLVERMRSFLGCWFTETSSLSALRTEGYAPTEEWRGAGSPQRVAVAPLLEQRRDRRTLEVFFEELGVRVMSAAEQVAELGHDGLAWLGSDGSAADRFLAYLSEIGERIDTLIVPMTTALGEAGEKIQILAASAKDCTSALPDLACFHWEESRRRLRARLIDLGTSITGDRVRAEEAFERAFALA